MKQNVPIIMQSFSASAPAFEAELDVHSALPGQIGVVAVQYVAWLEKRGVSETLKSERWKLLAANMWLATSQKK